MEMGNTPFISIARYGSCKKVLKIERYLISKGADVNAKNRFGVTVLMNAVTLGGNTDACNLKLVKFLISKGADIKSKNTWGKTALDNIKSYKHKNLQTLEYLKSLK